MDNISYIRQAVHETVKQEKAGLEGKSPEEQAEKYRFRFEQAAELIKGYTPLQWLIKGYIEKNSFISIFSPPASWKTFIALEMAYCIASGKSWHGNFIKSRGTVLYLCGEGHNGLARRLRALEIHHGILVADIPLFISSRPAAFLDKDGAAQVIAAIEALTDQYGIPALVIIDTLSRNFGGGDESNTRDMSDFVQVIDRDLRHRFGAAVLIVHHTGLSATDRGRGSSVLKGALDFEYLIEVNPDNTRTLIPKKTKDYEMPDEITFRHEVIELPEWTDPDTGEPLTSLVMIQTENPKKMTGVTLTGAKGIALKTLQECLSKMITNDNFLDSNKVKISFEDWKAAAFSGGISSGNEDAKRIAFDRSIKSLLNLNIIKTLDGFYWLNNDKK
jgi:hypothetical protein